MGLKRLNANEFPYQQPWPQQLGWYLEHQTGSKYLYIHRHWNKTRNLYHQAWTYPCYIQCSQNSLSNFLGQIVAKEKVTEKKIFCKILWYSKYYTEVLPKRFHLNGNNTGFHLQILMLRVMHTLYTLTITWSGSERINGYRYD